MHISGILVKAKPHDLPAVVASLDALRGVEVHHVDAESGKAVAVLETATVDEQEMGLRRIQALPRVAMAAFVEHRIEEDD